MTKPCTTAMGSVKSSLAEGFGDSRIGIRTIDAVMRVAQRLWPRKTAAELAVRANVSQRSCEFWISSKHNISGDALAHLLRSEEGMAFLEEVMGDAKPAWWKAFRRHSQIAKLRKEQEMQRLLLERLEREAAE